jgi:uncharacterized protein YjbJ (UPF0337 family)
MNTQELQARWGELRGKVKEKWGQLTNDDLQIVNGDIEQMISRIQRRTGADLEAIEDFISDLVPGGFSFQRAREAIASQAQAAADAVRGSYEDLSGRAREGANRAGRMLQDHPTQSMAAVLGTGVLCGVLVGLLISSDD